MRHLTAQDLWTETGIAPLHVPILATEIATEIAIIGGEFRGLSAALDLAEAGVGVAVLEAEAPV